MVNTAKILVHPYENRIKIFARISASITNLYFFVSDIFDFCFFTLVFAFCVNYRFVVGFKQYRLPTLILKCVLNVENCYAGFVK